MAANKKFKILFENANFKELFTDKKITEQYLTSLDAWVSKINNYEGEDKWLNKVDTCPWNKRNHILLILHTAAFYHHELGAMIKCGGKKLDNRITKVMDLFKNTTGYRQGHFDLEILIQYEEGSEPTYYIPPKSIAYGNKPPYLFLPHPDHLEEYKKFLPHFARTNSPKRLSKLLDDYFNHINSN